MASMVTVVIFLIGLMGCQSMPNGNSKINMWITDVVLQNANSINRIRNNALQKYDLYDAKLEDLKENFQGQLLELERKFISLTEKAQVMNENEHTNVNKNFERITREIQTLKKSPKIIELTKKVGKVEEGLNNLNDDFRDHHKNYTLDLTKTEQINKENQNKIVKLTNSSKELELQLNNLNDDFRDLHKNYMLDLTKTEHVNKENQNKIVKLTNSSKELELQLNNLNDDFRDLHKNYTLDLTKTEHVNKENQNKIVKLTNSSKELELQLNNLNDDFRDFYKNYTLYWNNEPSLF